MEDCKDKCTTNNIIRIIYDETFTKIKATVHLVNGEERIVSMNRHWCETKPPIMDIIGMEYQSTNKTDSFDLSYIPKKERTKEVCLQAFTVGKGLNYVPEARRDLELCVKFCQRDKENLRFVPDSLRNTVEKELAKK
jgi:hypothetical protein